MPKITLHFDTDIIEEKEEFEMLYKSKNLYNVLYNFKYLFLDSIIYNNSAPTNKIQGMLNKKNLLLIKEIDKYLNELLEENKLDLSEF